jgi:hypothetical protein
MVFGLTPAIAEAGPPSRDGDASVERAELQPEPSSEPESAPAPEPEPPRRASLKIVTSAVSIFVRAVSLEPEGSSVELGTPPIEAELPPGRYRVEVEGPGYRPWSREVELRAGELLELQAEPELIPGARLVLRARDEDSEGAAVYLDGEALCELPCSEIIEPGSHQLEIRKRRRKGLSFPLELAQADEVVVEVELEPSTSRAPAIVTGAVALTSLAVAVGFTIRSDAARRSLASDLQNLAQYDRDDRRIDNGRRDAVIAMSLYGATAAVGLLTLYYLLRQSGPPSQADTRTRSLARRSPPRWRLAPAFGPSGAGLMGVVEF